MAFEIRCETPADEKSIEAVTKAAFLEAARSSHTEQYIIDALRRAGKLALSLVATADGVVIGHVAVSPVAISNGAQGWFGLGPLAVLPQHQRQGVGSRLLCEALRMLLDQGAAGCVVLGEPEYYGRFGFKADADLVLPGVPPEYFQAVAFSSSPAKGTVIYHEAFEV